MNSSLTYAVLLYLNSYFFWMFTLCELCMGVYKMVQLPYSFTTFLTEILLFVFVCAIETARIFMGHKGNLMERSYPVMVSLTLSIPSAMGILYFLLWQTYILRAEIILCAIQLALIATEIVFGAVCVIKFYRNRIY